MHAKVPSQTFSKVSGEAPPEPLARIEEEIATAPHVTPPAKATRNHDTLCLNSAESDLEDSPRVADENQPVQMSQAEITEPQ